MTNRQWKLMGVCILFILLFPGHQTFSQSKKAESSLKDSSKQHRVDLKTERSTRIYPQSNGYPPRNRPLCWTGDFQGCQRSVQSVRLPAGREHLVTLSDFLGGVIRGGREAPSLRRKSTPYPGWKTMKKDSLGLGE